jgi:hypothetical protein
MGDACEIALFDPAIERLHSVPSRQIGCVIIGQSLSHRAGVADALDLTQFYQSQGWLLSCTRQRTIPSAVPGDQTMSVILRIIFIVAGLVTAVFVARDALNFELIQTWVSIVLVIVVVVAGSLWALRQKT